MLIYDGIKYKKSFKPEIENKDPLKVSKLLDKIYNDSSFTDGEVFDMLVVDGILTKND